MRLQPTQATRRQVWARAGGRCERCGKAPIFIGDRPHGLSLHHRLAHRNGGGRDAENLTLLCEPCHREENQQNGSLGRPRKPAGKKYISKHIKAHPVLWLELEEMVPPRLRTAFVREAVAAALKRLRRQRPNDGSPGEDQEAG